MRRHKGYTLTELLVVVVVLGILLGGVVVAGNWMVRGCRAQMSDNSCQFSEFKPLVDSQQTQWNMTFEFYRSPTTDTSTTTTITGVTSEQIGSIIAVLEKAKAFVKSEENNAD